MPHVELTCLEGPARPAPNKSYFAEMMLATNYIHHDDNQMKFAGVHSVQEKLGKWENREARGQHTYLMNSSVLVECFR